MSDLFDYLTGLYNRKGLYELWNQFGAESESLQICFLDLDNFKTVNDVYGHIAGDATLKRFAELLRKIVPEDGAAIRLGGDEFIILFPGRYERRALSEMAERLFGLVREEAALSKTFDIISVSMGIVHNADRAEGIDNLLSYSDAAMYYAKVSGKNQYIFFDDYEQRIRDEKEMEAAAVKALEDGRFHVFYYPIIHLQNARLICAGAVAAWEKEDGSFWHRKEFETVLEKIGFIKNIDYFTLEEVCRELQKLRRAGVRTNAVGIWLSGLLLEDSIVTTLKDVTARYEIPQEQIELWVDEKMFSARGVDSLLRKLREIRDAGFRIGLIGMGARFSGFPYLERLPLSTVLFDQKYVDETMHTKTREGLLHAMMQMAKELHFLSVGQGIDSAVEAELLMKCGCEAGSGNYFSKLLTGQEYGAYLNGIVERENVYRFAFQNSLLTTDGKYSGETLGEVQFTPGICQKWGSLHFVGGPVESNIVRIPGELFEGPSYTVTFWVKPHEVQNWISAFFARHQRGFSSFMPSISGNQVMYRVHQDESSEWTDVMYSALPAGKWTCVAIVYDAAGHNIRLFLNGELQGSRKNVPDIGRITSAYLGGDSYQVSFRGEISALCVYDHPRTSDEIRQSYLEDRAEEGFRGDEPADVRTEYYMHDPAVYEDRETHRFYLYCTGAQGWESEDLIHWRQLGKIVSGIPKDSAEWTGSDSIWAPDIVKVGSEYRLYCSNSSWGSQRSCIFLATAKSPRGPFVPKQAVLRTDDTLDVNGIDANIIEDHDTGEQYLLYGSFWGGIHLLPLDRETGLLRNAGADGNGVGSLRLMPFAEPPKEELEKRRGVCLVRRPLWTQGSVEGPYMIYHPDTKYYYLFVSYGSLKSDYNIRVGRSRKITGPFLDYHGNDLADPTDENLSTGLMIDCGYRWITGMPYMAPGHNSVLLRENGEMFLVSHIRKMRLMEDEPGPGLLQVRSMFMTPDGWPIASSQPYAAETYRIARDPVIPGKYERIELRPAIPQGIAHAHSMTLFEDGRMECGCIVGNWRRTGDFQLELEYGPIREFIHIEKSLDTDTNRTSVLLSGLTSQGICTWAKKAVTAEM